MSQDRGGRDVTFPDGSEGGVWVEPTAYVVTVHCPTLAAMEAVSEAVLGLREQASSSRGTRRTTVGVRREDFTRRPWLLPKSIYRCANGHEWWLCSQSRALPSSMPCPFCGTAGA